MRRIRTLSYLLAAAVLAGCGSDQGTNPIADTPSGVFVLQWVNDKALPFSTGEAGVVYTITSDRITLQKDGRFVESTTASLTIDGRTETATLPTNGTFVYTASTNAISLLASDGGQIAGTVLNDTMTLHDSGNTFVFYRQP
jgi:hypothetical protein